MTYSLDFRKKVLTVRAEEGLSLEAVANRFAIGKATVMRWLTRLEAKPTRERACPKLDASVVQQDVKAHPDAYLHERASRLGASVSGVHKALQRARLSRKKKP